ncbi:UDP-glucose 4-epimerase GalE [Indiicoccus explosivorum]|uniref:UDP-glucose 4-epimerase GalE n=1 Tax=Indiicoccus explosivorum TaxID=1917864 RepID=UPI000B450B5D|nr:UDP-glucose 4-epimerase GalE [Indiicoccus explosivorum]
MKVLVTGGLGYIGSHTAVELESRGIECVLTDRFEGNDERLGKIRNLVGRDIKYKKCDLLIPNQLRYLFRHYQIDGVLHFAGLKSVGESVQNPLKYYDCNVTAAINLLKVMKEKEVKTLVFSSSATVYGDITQPPIPEESPTAEQNPYGRTKRMIEEILKDLADSDPAWRIAILRYFNPVGAHESALIGENPEGVPNNLMPYIAQVASGVRNELNVFGGDYETVDGTGVRDFIHVMDLAAGHSKALRFLQTNTGQHIFNLGTGVGYSVLNILREFEVANGVSIPYRVTDRRPGDVAASFADPTKAEQLLGWKAEKGLSEMCRDAWRWELNKSSRQLLYLEKTADSEESVSQVREAKA